MVKALPKPQEQPGPSADGGWKFDGRKMEQEGHFKDAIAHYQQTLKRRPLDAEIYDRLMIVLRKDKQYRKELTLINQAIQKFTKLLTPDAAGHSKTVRRLSKSIASAVGLVDKKGKPVYAPPIIVKWEKRKQTLHKKLGDKV